MLLKFESILEYNSLSYKFESRSGVNCEVLLLEF